MIGTIICALVEWHQISRSGISATGRRHRSENGAGLFWWRRLAPWRLPEDFPQPIPWCIGPAASITRWSCLVRSTWCLTTRWVQLKPGDTVVQQATNHAWVNHAKETCRILFVLMDSRQP